MVRESLRELEGGVAPPRPWEDAVRRRNAAERVAYAEAAGELRKSAAKADGAAHEQLLKDAEALEIFGRTLSKPRTRRERWAEKFSQTEMHRQSPTKDHDHDIDIS
jgi:hypothetical protein